MAYCITTQWVDYAPQAKLTVVLNTSKSDGDTAALDWTLEYVAHGYAASTSTARSYIVSIDDGRVASGTYNINGVTSTKTIDSGTVYVNKSTSATNVSFIVSFAFNLTWSGVYKGTLTASSTISIPAKTSYSVTYNANGGSGAPAKQTKWFGTALTLSSTKPTRTGYTFKGWSTANDTSVEYAAGDSYTANSSVTLYAVWTANKYTITYDANGGTGAPSSQTKTYGVSLTLSGVIPTRTNYKFLGWATSASATKATYAAGATYTANTGAKLYAIWELAYLKPRITKYSVVRGTYEDGIFTETSSGTYMRIMFTYECDLNSGTVYTAYITDVNGEQIFETQRFLSEYSGTEIAYVDASSLSSEASYTVKLIVDDTGGNTTVYTTLNGAVYAVDALAGGKGISFGKPAELEGVADFAFDAKFNKPVYGKALGMDRVPSIPANSDLNNYIDPGCYAVYGNAAAETIANMPIARAGRLEVWSATGEGVRSEQWSYLRQRYIPYNSANAVWERDITRGEDNVWVYYDWWKSSLTPIASEKVYSKAVMTIALSTNTTLGIENTYTKIPLDKSVLSTSNRLTLQDNSIRIGADIQYVKISGQALIKCGSTAGNRHARIQKNSNGTITSHSWDCVYGAANGNTEFPFTPMIIPVSEGDLIFMVYYTGDVTDLNASGSATNGWQTYLTVEEL